MIKIEKRGRFWAGVTIVLVLIASYFVKFRIDSGANYELHDSLLGIVIFHNPFILGLYVLIATVLIFNGLKKKSLFIRFK